MKLTESSGRAGKVEEHLAKKKKAVVKVESM